MRYRNRLVSLGLGESHLNLQHKPDSQQERSGRVVDTSNNGPLPDLQKIFFSSIPKLQVEDWLQIESKLGVADTIYSVLMKDDGVSQALSLSLEDLPPSDEA